MYKNELYQLFQLFLLFTKLFDRKSSKFLKKDIYFYILK